MKVHYRDINFIWYRTFQILRPGLWWQRSIQAFFTLSVGMGGMAIFGSYLGDDRSLLGESVHVITLDTFVAIVSGLIIFPSCYAYGLEVTAGPALLFDTMATVFRNIPGGESLGKSVLYVYGLCSVSPQSLRCVKTSLPVCGR